VTIASAFSTPFFQPLKIGIMAKQASQNGKYKSKKTEDLAGVTKNDANEFLTTNHGVRINDNQNSLKDGDRGGTLIEDFILREKIHHFDHERIPERIVHARGSAAHGYFELNESLEKFTKAKLFTHPT
jgi:catalase